ncbi:MAG: hypothetical protein HC886_14640 [Leptolyngbyaceae cyanobacterium SM1_1_3]|nr:hypothetical protein [Leptolyngbyaceae cyanobacterium SM1_1_3]
MITADLSRFWLIGCNSWAWKYLNIVCQIEAYLEQTAHLPRLEGEQLQNWLQPLLKTLDTQVHLAEGRSQSDTSREEKATALYEDLANISHGISGVAARLWRTSLRYQLGSTKSESETDPDSLPPEATVAEILAAGSLKQQRARYPEMPDLSAAEDYLIYAILLHGSITVPHLALSLGELEVQVRAQVQKLLRQEVLHNQDGILTVEPAYYPKLQDRLRQNNFVIGGDR